MILAHKIHCNINIFKRFKLLEGGSLLKKSRYEEALPPCPPPLSCVHEMHRQITRTILIFIGTITFND